MFFVLLLSINNYALDYNSSSDDDPASVTGSGLTKGTTNKRYIVTDDKIQTTYDAIAPILSITTPANGSITHEDTLIIEWIGKDVDSGIDYYEVFLNGTTRGKTTTSMMLLRLTENEGIYNITVVAYDKAENQNQASIWVRKYFRIPCEGHCIVIEANRTPSTTTPIRTPGFLMVYLISGLVVTALVLLIKRSKRR